MDNSVHETVPFPQHVIATIVALPMRHANVRSSGVGRLGSFSAPAEWAAPFVEPRILLHHLARAGEVVSRRRNQSEDSRGNQETRERSQLGAEQCIVEKPVSCCEQHRNWRDFPSGPPVLGERLTRQESRTAEDRERHYEERAAPTAEQLPHGCAA